MKKLILVLGLAAVASGCSMLGDNSPFRDRSSDYLRSETSPEMRVPADLDGAAAGQLFPIPPVGQVPTYQLADSFETPRIDYVPGSDDPNAVRIQRLGNDVWILTAVPPSQTWPRIRNFLTANRIPTESANAAVGVIDTGWFSVDQAPDTVQQFRFRLEQGVQVNTTEITVQQRQFVGDQVPAALREWGQATDDPAMADWMRGELSTYLADAGGLGSASLMGQEIGAASKVTLETPQAGQPYLRMSLAQGRAWGSLAYALGTESFEVLAQDSANLTMDFAFYAEPPEEVSWFGRLTGRGNPRPEQYRLQMVEDVQGYRVVLRTLSGQMVDARTAYAVLTRIRNNLT